MSIVIVFFGVVYLVYSLISRGKITLYFSGVQINDGYEQKYLRLQLYSAIFNSGLVILFGVASAFYNLRSVYIMIVPMIFHIINLVTKIVCISKGYIEKVLIVR